MEQKVEKITERMYYEMIAKRCEDDEKIVEFCEKKIDQLDRKQNSKNSKANAEMENAVQAVYDALKAVGRMVTVSELIGSSDLSALANENGLVTPQKISNYLRRLKKDGKVRDIKDKKKTYFEIVN